MDFTLSDEQKMLRHGAERYLTENYDFEKRKALIERDHGFSESQWRQFAEMGWLALPIPEDCDGLGGGFVDITLMQELFGRRLVLEPFATTAILSAFLLDGCEDKELRSSTLRSIAADEGRHSAHAWKVLDWCLATGGPGVAFALDGLLATLPSREVPEAVTPMSRGEGERYGLPGTALEREERAKARDHLVQKVRWMLMVHTAAAKTRPHVPIPRDSPDC